MAEWEGFETFEESKADFKLDSLVVWTSKFAS